MGSASHSCRGEEVGESEVLLRLLAWALINCRLLEGLSSFVPHLQCQAPCLAHNRCSVGVSAMDTCVLQ